MIAWIGRAGVLSLASALAAAVSAPTWARAAEGGEAAALVRAGAAEFAKEEYDAARESFAQAYAIEPRASTLLSLALVELQANMPVQAAEHFRAYLGSPEAPEDKRGAVQSKWLPRAEALLARVQLVVPAGAEIFVDGRPAARDPSLGVFEVSAGEHDIDVRSAGRSETRHVEAVAGATITMRALVDDPVTPPPPPPPRAETVEEPPPADPPVGKVVSVVALGVGALAGVGVGVGFGVAAQHKASTIAGREGCVAGAPRSIPCQRLNFDVSLEHRDEWISIGGYVGAGVLGAASLATWFLWPHAPARVTAVVDGRHVGLGVEGRW